MAEILPERRRRHRGLWIAGALLLVLLAFWAGDLLGVAGGARHLDRRYAEVRQLLRAGDWQSANQALSEIVLIVAGRRSEGWLDRRSVETLPCQDLAYIDRLYRDASDGRFGYAPQLAIWQALPEGPAREKLLAFAEQVGWRAGGRWLAYEELTFSTEAPIGHLPVFFPETGLRTPFKTRKGTPEERGLLLQVLDRRYDDCLLAPTPTR